VADHAVNVEILSDVLFAVGRRHPLVPLATIRRLPLRALHLLRRPGLRRTFTDAARAPYYREAFKAAGIDARAARRPQDLGGFYLTGDVLKTTPESLVAGTPELAIESSGTSGRVSRVYLSHAELEYSARQGGLLLALLGLVRGDRLLCTLDYGWGLGALLVERGVRHTPLFAMVPGRVDPAEAYDRLGTYGINVLVSDPFWLARLTEIARERGRPRAMKLLYGGGEGVTARARAELERFWDAPLCMTYASTEAATVLGFECRERNGYHVNEFDFDVELREPDALGYGEIVMTTVHRRVMPLVRYRTGDVARWIEGRCACGLPFRRVSSIRGRVDEQVSCAWGNLFPDFFERLLAGVPGLGADWQVALYERELKPVVQFRLEVGEPPVRERAVRAIVAALERDHPDAWLAYRRRLIDIEFCFFDAGRLRQAKKLKRLVDERERGLPAWLASAVVTLRPAGNGT
jgi:phenylacetate-CoA ligase